MMRSRVGRYRGRRGKAWKLGGHGQRRSVSLAYRFRLPPGRGHHEEDENSPTYYGDIYAFECAVVVPCGTT